MFYIISRNLYNLKSPKPPTNLNHHFDKMHKPKKKRPQSNYQTHDLQRKQTRLKKNTNNPKPKQKSQIRVPIDLPVGACASCTVGSHLMYIFYTTVFSFISLKSDIR